MPGFSGSRKPGVSKLRNDASQQNDHPRSHDQYNVDSELAFIARVRKMFVAGNPTSEFEHAIALKYVNTKAFIVMQRSAVSRASRDDQDRKKFSGPISRFPVSTCIKITPWKSVQETGTMAIHFEKLDNIALESKEVLNARRAGKLGNSRTSERTSRTKCTIITVRRWSQEHGYAVQQVWEELNNAAIENRVNRPVESPNHRSDRVTFPRSVIDEKTRMKERRRYSEDHRLLPSISQPSHGRLTQGQKIMKALSSSSQQKGGRYSALTRGVTGRRSFSDALVGSPNLEEFDKHVTKPERGFSKTAGTKSKPFPSSYRKHAGSDTLVPSTQLEPIEIDDPKTSLNASRNHHRGHGSGGASLFSGQLEGIGIDGDATPLDSSRKRKRDLSTSAEVAAKRRKYLSEQLKSHMASSQSVPAKRPSHSSLQSLSNRPRASSLVPASGIANDGNTCYLSAILQALMSDGDLMCRIEKQSTLRSSSMSFSAALMKMSRNRKTLKTLKPGLARQAISKHYAQFSSSDQQDAHEFFLRCLDVVAKECSSSNFRDSPVHTNYSLVQERKFTCTACGHQTEPRREILRGLSLDLPEVREHSCDAWESPAPSVEDLLSGFFASQDVMLDCESCDGKNAKSDTKIVLSPHSLVLHIKRFGLDYQSADGNVSIKKISDPVGIPETICLDTILEHSACSSIPQDPGAKIDGKQSEIFQKSDSKLPDRNHARLLQPSAPQPVVLSSPTKTQALDEMTQFPSPCKTNHAFRPRPPRQPFDIARRYRVHADKPRNSSLSLVDGSNRTVQVSTQSCEPIDVEFDDIQEETGSSQLGTPLDHHLDIQHVRAIVNLGISDREARQVLKEANYDVTLAMGVALDRMQQLQDNPKDLNEDLLSHIHQLEKQDGFCPDPTQAKYKLAAVIRHHSDSTDRGHYVADVLQPDGSWFCYDDSSVFKLQSTELQAREGYLCWYIAT